MRPLLSTLFALLILTGPATAAEPGAAEQATIRRVIESQLAAFQRDDGVTAWSYAAPGIQHLYQTPDIFMEMVRTGYRPVYRPREVEFRELRTIGGTVQQEVLFVGPDGNPVLALYTMEQQPDGSWRIAGVTLLAARDEMT